MVSLLDLCTYMDWAGNKGELLSGFCRTFVLLSSSMETAVGCELLGVPDGIYVQAQSLRLRMECE